VSTSASKATASLPAGEAHAPAAGAARAAKAAEAEAAEAAEVGVGLMKQVQHSELKKLQGSERVHNKELDLTQEAAPGLDLTQEAAPGLMKLDSARRYNQLQIQGMQLC
jgi:hypothetical protein